MPVWYYLSNAFPGTNAMDSVLPLLVAMVCALTCLCAATSEIVCAGTYRSHIQGIASDRKGTIYWSFTRNLVKTDMSGRVLEAPTVPHHHGDLTHVNGKLYVAWSNYFNRPGANSKVYVYDAKDLSQIAIESVPEVTFGAGAIEHHRGHFFVVGGRPEGSEPNCVYEYDSNFTFVKRHVLSAEPTFKGVQAIGHWHGRWWLGCYHGVLLETDDQFNVLAAHRASYPYGIVAWDATRCLVGFHFGKSPGACRGKACFARADAKLGLVVLPASKGQ